MSAIDWRCSIKTRLYNGPRFFMRVVVCRRDGPEFSLFLYHAPSHETSFQGKTGSLIALPKAAIRQGRIGFDMSIAQRHVSNSAEKGAACWYAALSAMYRACAFIGLHKLANQV
jgi:hypothetical protein